VNECCLLYLWTTEYLFNPICVKQKVNRILTDQFTQEWNSIIYHSPKCIKYILVKESLILESYLTILPRKYAILLCKFRCNNIRSSIESGRWKNTPRNLCFYSLCNQNNVGDEYHYIFECTHYDTAFARKSFLPKKFIKKTNIMKFKELLATSNFDNLKTYANCHLL
jgi:hypothetical protein